MLRWCLEKERDTTNTNSGNDEKPKMYSKKVVHVLINTNIHVAEDGNQIFAPGGWSNKCYLWCLEKGYNQYK